MMEGDFFIGASLATTLAKLALRYKTLESNIQKSNRLQAEAMFVMSSVLQLGRSGLPIKAMTHDDAERISLCLRSLACPTPLVQQVFTEGCRDALGRMLAAKAEEDSQNQKVIIFTPDNQIGKFKIYIEFTINFCRQFVGKSKKLKAN